MYIFLMISNGSGSNCKPVITVGAWLGKNPVACAAPLHWPTNSKDLSCVYKDLQLIFMN